MIGGILLLRLHAFVALVLAALIVSTLTPPELILRSQSIQYSVPVRIQSAADGGFVLTSTQEINTQQSWSLLGISGETVPQTSEFRLVSTDVSGQFLLASGSERAIDFLWKGIGQAGGSGDYLIVPTSRLEGGLKLARQPATQRVSEALGNACGKLAILIAAASIIGTAMLQSGSADRIVTSTLERFGERGAPFAFAVSGFTLAIPVFFDTVFLLMMPLGIALFRKTKRNYLLSVLSIVVGGTMAHSLVPPTPGPLLIAEAFQVPMLSMVIGGTLVGLFGSATGLALAFWINQRAMLVPPDEQVVRQIQQSDESPKSMPGIIEALLPVFLPILQMTLDAGFDSDTRSWSIGPVRLGTAVSETLHTCCEKSTAIMIGAVCSIVTWVRFQRPGRDAIASHLQTAITGAGTIILVTAAGGAFGAILQQTSIAESLGDLPMSSPLIIVIASFLVTAAVRTAQGSATVAMMTSAGIFGGIVTSGAAGVDPLWVALAVGCGSKPFPWMNDSGFLVITRMSGMTESEGLRYVSPVMSTAGCAGLVAIILGMFVLGP
ncbi:MAG: GntP family permease [Planctomyces sp.]|nr:GntP family permease [Planctomyces sp.]